MVDTVSPVVGAADGCGVRGDLLLAGLRLRIVAASPQLLDSVVGVLAPACEVELPAAGEPDWTLTVDQEVLPVEAESLFEGRLVLTLPYGGRQLAVLDAAEGVLRLAARYRSGTAPVVLEVDAAHRSTWLVLSLGDGVGVRWADWLARVFFASRLLASGWRMLHASAVAVDGSALVFLAGQRGGKSTLAHRAVRETGALFMADDLVLVGSGGMVVGFRPGSRCPPSCSPGSRRPWVGRSARWWRGCRGSGRCSARLSTARRWGSPTPLLFRSVRWSSCAPMRLERAASGLAPWRRAGFWRRWRWPRACRSSCCMSVTRWV